MSKQQNKSLFDILFEDVMQDELNDLDALGIDSAEGDGLDGEEVVDEAEPVTVTLSQDQVAVLRDILAQVDGLGEDEGFEGEDEFGAEGGFEDEGDMRTSFEGIEAEEIGHPLVNQKDSGLAKNSAGSNKVPGKPTSLVKNGKAQHVKPTTKHGDVDEDGHPLVNQKDRGNLTKVGAGSNKVKSTKTSTPGADFFG